MLLRTKTSSKSTTVLSAWNEFSFGQASAISVGCRQNRPALNPPLRRYHVGQANENSLQSREKLRRASSSIPPLQSQATSFIHPDSLHSLQKFHTSLPSRYQAKLTPAEVTAMLRGNEYTNSDLPPGPVKSFETNCLRSNNPVEDSHSEAIVSNGEGYLFGIYDGHGGAACGQVTAKRLQNYIAAGLLGQEDLEAHLEIVAEAVHSNNSSSSEQLTFIQTFNEQFELVQDLRDIYMKSYYEYLVTLSNEFRTSTEAPNENIEKVLVTAFNTLDNDMSREALPCSTTGDGKVNMKTLTVAMSGCVAVVTHIDGPHLHVASTGDCTAVIGSLSENDTWLAKKLTNEHNSDNNKEVKRILDEHPESEHHHIIKGDRLLSMLAPLRAFGDFKFKWDRKIIEETLGQVLGDRACPPNYKTPPYLTAEPEVSYHRLTPRDKFLVIGSDGLWDMMTPMQVIRLVGEHMSGKLTLSPLHLAEPHIPLEDIAVLLRKRQAAMKLKPVDTNASTHLIRCALGGTAYGVDHSRLSQMLSLPQDMVRMFRDDITITVVFFDDEYLKYC
jgi:pyruvate dehydrogenase phosphatase